MNYFSVHTWAATQSTNAYIQHNCLMLVFFFLLFRKENKKSNHECFIDESDSLFTGEELLNPPVPRYTKTV